MDDAERAGDQAGKDQWRGRLHMYLDTLFRQDSSAGASYHDLQVRCGPAASLSSTTLDLRRLWDQLPDAAALACRILPGTNVQAGAQSCGAGHATLSVLLTTC